jgi:hypothetical protein
MFFWFCSKLLNVYTHKTETVSATQNDCFEMGLQNETTKDRNILKCLKKKNTKKHDNFTNEK